jgi:ATPase subunit of ABC transporter with duplicated ATPase domains
MESARSAAEKLATTDAQRDALAAATESLRADYLKQYRSLMSARAGAYSGFVAGENLNSKQANSRNSALDKAMERFDSWVGDNADRASKAVLAARTPEQVKADRDAVPPRSRRRPTKRLLTSRQRCSSS